MSGKMSEEGAGSSSAPATIEQQFAAFAKFGDIKSDGKTIALSQADKWFKQAKVIDKKITTTDTGIHFKKFKATKIGMADFQKYIDDLANAKKVDAAEIRKKLTTCGLPGFSKTTVTVKSSAVERLTDTTKYTGSHKERFDESGKGKGIEGRKEASDGSGYVTGYKNKNTYGKGN